MLTDDEAKEMIQIVIKNKRLKQMNDCDEDEKNRLMKECANIDGISKRQLARIFKFDKRKIDKMLK